MSSTNLTNYQVSHAVTASYVDLDELYVQLLLYTAAAKDVAQSVRPYLQWIFASIMATNSSLYQSLTWSNGLTLILLTLVLINAKSLPFVHHLRLLNGVRHLLKSQRSPKPFTPSQLFQPLITSSRAPLMEMDVYGHKSNSTYFTDHDIARTHLLTTMFSRAIEKVRGSVVMNGLSGKKRSAFTIPLGAVTCSFRKELKPYEPYDMWTRILSWDEKWIYVVTHFVKKGAKIEPEEMTLYPGQATRSHPSKKPSGSNSGTDLTNTSRVSTGRRSLDVSDSPIAASAMSKLVFKDGRRTIAPETMLEAAGLLPSAHHEGGHDKATDLSNPLEISKARPVNTTSGMENTGTKTADTVSDSGSPYDPTTKDSVRLHLYDRPTRTTIEAERIRGLRLASMLAGMTELEHEFRGRTALGKHHDGLGIEGVAATLLQLGKLSSYQLI